jgi:hypothetical protein
MERNGISLGRGEGNIFYSNALLFSYFISLLVSRAFSCFSYLAAWIECGCTFSLPHSPRCVSYVLNILFLKMFRVSVKKRIPKQNCQSHGRHRVISSLDSFSFFSFVHVVLHNQVVEHPTANHIVQLFHPECPMNILL